MKEKIELIFDRYRHCKMFEDDKASNNFVELIGRAVSNLPDIENEIIEKRYMSKDAAYITDRNVYQFEMTDPIAAPYFIKVRTRAFESIAIMLHLDEGALYD